MNTLCPNCGRPIVLADPDAGNIVTCAACEQQFPARQAIFVPPSPESEAPKRRRWLAVLLLIILAAVVLAGLFLPRLHARPDSPKPSPESPTMGAP